MKKLTAAILAAALLPGCSQRVIDFTVLSTKNIDLSRSADLKRVQKRVKGEDIVPVVLLPFGIPNAKTAIDKAIESTPGAVALTDGVINQRITLFFGITGFEVEGTPLVDPKQAAGKL
ncbi:hypothetical protein JCM19379_07030 [Methyloparacoccus murrellii]|jgi:hypothetical protein